jgi:hypothetical protein
MSKKAGAPLRGRCCYRDPLGMWCCKPARFEIHLPGPRTKPRTEACEDHVALMRQPGESVVRIPEEKDDD